MSHHGNNPFPADDDERRAMSEAMKELLGEFPDGKLRLDDEGAIAMTVGEQDGRVILRFPKPVAWIGFTPEQGLALAEDLIRIARRCGSTQPLVITIGESKP